MAVPFCKMRPELREVLAGAKAEIAALQRAIGFSEGGVHNGQMGQPLLPGEADVPLWGVRVGSTMPDEVLLANRARAEDVRGLFAAHFRATGVVLCVDGIRQVLDRPLTQADECRRAMDLSALRLRLSENRQTGISESVYQRALLMFSAIWPEDLAWPISTPRPTPQTKQEQS